MGSKPPHRTCKLERNDRKLELKLYNTLTRKKEPFTEIEKGKVKIYSCGPTVYSYAHIGNFRAYIFMDTLRRVLKYNGYELKHAMNITDVGHLESDADEGEDKIAKAAKKENKDPYEIAAYYTDKFLKDLEKLNIDKPEIICKATDHIKEMQEYVKKIIENDYGYETSRGIYFDISKLDKYPILSDRKIDEQIAGARVEVDKEKRNPEDFAIWIKAPENHIMKWQSPWGLSYPGWHIECSAMSTKYLGEEFDIHTGGIDHIPTHHENEIAQSKGNTGKIPAKYWMHCNFLSIDGGKMSKSLGNTYTLDILQEKGIEPLAYKLFCYTSHYRNKLNFTFEGAKSAETSLIRLREGYQKHLEGTEKIETSEIKELEEKFETAINDDLNMPVAISVVWDIIKNPKKSKQLAELLKKFDQILGIEIDKKEEIEIPEEIKELIEQRNKARQEKDWEKSDQIRDKIKEKGYIIKDTKDGITIEKA
ncbi:MAG: cysteine--tRNA ligase [Clostridia bacterium]|nr:cysteine--tRNA ligase [Clostridia bacterium]